ncbi:MAG: hypothetical protein R6U20_10840 [Longimonas sp.]|uniref:hypothetical protein n=1 Tax=Longimonas sp. TaxID=2039626 RepID=UPI003975AFC1
MKIPVSDTLLDETAEGAISVPLSEEEADWLTRQAEQKDLSKRQFIRYMINRIKDAEEAVQRGRKA